MYLRPQFVRSKNKYKNVKSEKILENGDKVIVDSLLEGRLFDVLFKSKNDLGIKEIKTQVKFQLIDNYHIKGIHVNKEKLKKQIGNRKYDYRIEEFDKENQGIKYIADFVLEMNNGDILVLDAKGVETEVFKIKKKLFENRYGYSILCLNSYVINNGIFTTYLKEKYGGKK